ncbi:CHASE2 domain-containing protein [Egbenema bharatensis]|uniref:CHASE2 domain-containing protein n=1 Tax=Egbenema bharatensis TaxID=3463334 RepID=UPI003A84D1C0
MGKMNHRRWERIRDEIAIWRIGALPGLLVIGLVVLLRLMGTLQFSEWWMLDFFLRSRPPEPTDERILIVGINEADIQANGHPISDETLAELIEALQIYEPRVIGLDIVRDLPVEPGHDRLNQVFQSPNIIGIEALPNANGNAVSPPPGLPPEQIGFADVFSDADGALRRSLLDIALFETESNEAESKFSLALLLAEAYLNQEGIYLDNGIRDPDAMRFGSAEIPQLRPNSGGYVNADTDGNQTLIHYRSGDLPFRQVSMADILSGNVPEDWIRDRIILIGSTAISLGDLKLAPALANNDNAGLTYGVKIHAHITSQIISAVLDDRPLLRTWANGWDYVWIIAWGLLGILLSRVLASPFKTLLALGIASALLFIICVAALMAGWWLPIVPALGVLILNSAGLTAALFYRHQQDLQAKIHDRQSVIEQTFDAIHNGPLQTLAGIMRNCSEESYSRDQLYAELQTLNHELRTVYDAIRQETLTPNGHFYLCNGEQLDLQHPTHELLHAVYRATLNRPFPSFEHLKVKVVSFQFIDVRILSTDQKRGLCRFLEEALCNAGKYARDMTRLEVSCKPQPGKILIRIADNGKGLPHTTSSFSGRGSHQATMLAKQLNGSFHRLPNSPQGTLCELTYPIAKPWFG